MNENKLIRKILHNAKLSAKGKNIRALKCFNKLRSESLSDYASALLDFHQGLCELKKGDIAAAVSMLRRSAETFEEIKKPSLASISYMRLGDTLCTDHRYDEACEVLCIAEKLSDNFLRQCEIKTILAAARMASDTIYDTSLFTEPCEFMLPHIDAFKSEIIKYFSRACLIAAKACEASNNHAKSTEYCLHCINACESSADSAILNIGAKSAVLLCRNSVLSWDNSLMEFTSKTAYEYINSKPSTDSASSDFVRLFHACCLLRDDQIRKAKNVLSCIDKSTLNETGRICYEYCSCMCHQEKFDINNSPEIKSVISSKSTDDINILAESVVDAGFPEAAADIYSHILSSCGNDKKALIARPLASLLYKLERYSESAHYYSEFVNECSEPVLKRAYSLSCLKSGDSENAQKQMTAYIDASEDRLSALSVGAMLALDEGYPADFCSKLYTELSERLEKEKGSTEETVDAYNRLGICLYRSGAPLKEETDAFKKAAEHAEACNATLNSNIHAVILCNLAECRLRSGNIDECYDIYMSAESIFSDIDSPDIIQFSSCLKFISDILLMREDADGAVQKLKKAISILEPHADTDKTAAQQLSLCHNTLGTVYFRQGKPELEIPELTRAIDLVKDHPIDKASLSLLYSNRGEAYELTEKYDLMLSDYTTFIELSEDNPAEEKSDTRISKAAKWLSIGRYKENSQQHNDAIDAYKSALSLLQRSDFTDDIEINELTAFAYYQLGNAYCHHNIKNYSEGLASYSNSINILKQLPQTETRKMHLASTYEARSSFYEIFGEHMLSAADLSKAKELRHSISFPE